MNQIVCLLKLWNSLQLKGTEGLVSIDDIQLLIATDQYNSACHYIQQHIKYHVEVGAIPEESYQIQLLKNLHNTVITKGVDYQRDYADSIFDLIRQNHDLTLIIDYPSLLDHGQNLNDPDSYEQFVLMGKTVNAADFYNKELCVFFIAKILEMHDVIKKMESNYL